MMSGFPFLIIFCLSFPVCGMSDEDIGSSTQSIPDDTQNQNTQTTDEPNDSCRHPSRPTILTYETIDESTVNITWKAAIENLKFEVVLVQSQSRETNISTTYFEFSYEFRPMTHYEFHIRSSSHCQGNGSKIYSAWVEIDVYTPPLKPVLEVLETGSTYVVVDVHSSAIYESISIYINDRKQFPDSTGWPHRIDNLDGMVDYRISVEASKYGQSARSDEILLQLPTLAPTTPEPEREADIASWAIVAGVVLLMLSAILYGQIKERMQLKRSSTMKGAASNIYADARYMEPQPFSDKPSTSSNDKNANVCRISGFYDQSTEESHANQFISDADYDGDDDCSKNLNLEEITSSYPVVLNPLASHANEYLEAREVEVVFEDQQNEQNLDDEGRED